MPTKTYKPIATTTLGSNVATYTFSSIPSTYTDLVLAFSTFSSSSGSGMYLQFNGDNGVGSLYSNTVLYGDGSTAGQGRTSSTGKANFFNAGSTTDSSVSQINVMNYANSTTYKTVISKSMAPVNYSTVYVGLWRNANSITSITIGLVGAGTINAGTTFTLYGIE